MISTISCILVWAILLLSGCATIDNNDMKTLETVDFVDLKSFTGKWYEIARYHNRFQEGCFGSTATYSLRSDGKLNVVNECYDKSLSGKLRSVKGKAWVVDDKTNSRLKVSFFWPFSGHYWIIELDPDYEYAVVGHPDRKYLWILSRTPVMDEKTYVSILDRLQKQGYDTSKLIKTMHNNNDSVS